MRETQNPLDGEGFLSDDDIQFLKKRLWKNLRGGTSLAILCAMIGVLTQTPITNAIWPIGAGFWAIAIVVSFLRTRHLINRGSKKILRGEIAQRYKSTGEEDTNCVFYINGKRLAVPDAIFKKYFARDIAEFHYLDDIILQDKLLKRGDKDYS